MIATTGSKLLEPGGGPGGHVYERTVPISALTYLVNGGGGRRLYRAGEGKLTAYSKSVHHAVLVHRLLLEAVEPDGSVFDRWQLLQTREPNTSP